MPEACLWHDCCAAALRALGPRFGDWGEGPRVKPGADGVGGPGSGPGRGVSPGGGCGFRRGHRRGLLRRVWAGLC